MMKGSDSSPYDVPPSPRLFWQGRDSGSPFQKSSENQAPYDPETSVISPKRRSLENLKSVSKVKNSAMFRDQQEYDPTQIYVPQRPLAPGRSWQRHDQEKPQTHHRDDQSPGPRPPSPSKDRGSPAKSSLSKATRFGAKGSFDPEKEIWSDIDGYRHAKSVTFDVAPPQVNEYEMTTPDPSSIASGSHDGSYDSEEDEEDISFEHDSSMDRDDSFDASLEDIEKTPVVLPEDWRFMSPSNANDQLVKEDEDPFTAEESRSPEVRPSTAPSRPVQHTRVESMDSNGERRPLPPLPSATRDRSSPRPMSAGKLNVAFELGNGGQRNLPAPPGPATHSKADLTAPMSLEDRLRLIMIEDNLKEEETSAKDENAPREANPAAQHEHKGSDQVSEKPDAVASDSFFSPPRISRDSILRDIRKSESIVDDSYEYSSQHESSPQQYMHYDPDVPVPSVENDHDDDDTNSVIVKEEQADEDLYSIPQYYEQASSKDSSFRDLHEQSLDDGSSYSRNTTDELQEQSSGTGDTQPTPVPEQQAAQDEPRDRQVASETTGPKMAAMRETLQRPVTPPCEDEKGSEPSTPDSVIRHPVDDEDSDGQPVPDPLATVRAPHGSGLKTRPSFTPADLESMAATRRKVSGQPPPPMHLPKKEEDAGQPEEQPHDSEESAESAETSGKLAPPVQFGKDAPQRQPSLVKLDIPFSIQEESLGFGLDKEFDRVIESQKVAFDLSLSRSSCPSTQDPFSLSNQGNPMDFSRFYSGISADQAIPKQRGYLMRHNTKVIIASSRNDEESAPQNGETPAGSSGSGSAASPQRKVSQQTWTTEPWNGKTRRSSVRMASGIPKKKPVPGSVPPLPGQPSNVQDPSAAEEPEPALNEALEDGEERGRLFVKVVGMKYLDLPLPRGKTTIVPILQD